MIGCRLAVARLERERIDQLEPARGQRGDRMDEQCSRDSTAPPLWCDREADDHRRLESFAWHRWGRDAHAVEAVRQGVPALRIQPADDSVAIVGEKSFHRVDLNTGP